MTFAETRCIGLSSVSEDVTRKLLALRCFHDSLSKARQRLLLYFSSPQQAVPVPLVFRLLIPAIETTSVPLQVAHKALTSSTIVLSDLSNFFICFLFFHSDSNRHF